MTDRQARSAATVEAQVERELRLAIAKARMLAQVHRDVPLDSLICDLEMIARIFKSSMKREEV